MAKTTIVGKSLVKYNFEANTNEINLLKSIFESKKLYNYFTRLASNRYGTYFTTHTIFNNCTSIEGIPAYKVEEVYNIDIIKLSKSGKDVMFNQTIDIGVFKTDKKALKFPICLFTITSPDSNKYIIAIFYKKQKTLFINIRNNNNECRELYSNIFDILIETNNIEQVLELDTKCVKVTLGCDPEFEYITPRGSVESMSDTDADIISSIGDDRIGVDGSGDQVELRPEPADDAKGIVENLREVMEVLNENEVRLSTIGNELALGGHIHIGFLNKTGNPEVTNPDISLLKLYDFFLYSKFESLNGRARGCYKGSSQSRGNDHGFEYRSLPSAAFYHPELTEIVFKIIKNLTENFYSGMQFIIDEEEGVTAKDYIKYCDMTEEEVKKFEEHLGIHYNDMNYSKNIVENWVNREPQFNIIFKGEYPDEIKEKIKNIFSNWIPKKYSSICFFGLKRSRGERKISGFTAFAVDTIDVGVHYAGFNFGFSRDLRELDDSENVKSLTSDSLASLKTYLETKFRLEGRI